MMTVLLWKNSYRYRFPPHRNRHSVLMDATTGANLGIVQIKTELAGGGGGVVSDRLVLLRISSSSTCDDDPTTTKLSQPLPKTGTTNGLSRS
jgi:hypothetical protein